MTFTRREFIKGGVSAFTIGFAAPAFLSDLAVAQGSSRRSLVVLYLSGGNDALSMLVPYTDSFYYSRRPTLAVPAGSVLQIGGDSTGKPLGLHPRLTTLRQIYDQGRLAFVQRTGYANSSRSHFLGTDIWSTANPGNTTGDGWLGRYLETLPSPVDPLTGWSTVRELPHTLKADRVSVPSIPSVAGYALQSPNTGIEGTYSRAGLEAFASHLPPERPHLSFVNTSIQAALATLDRVGTVATYVPTVAYPTSGLGQAFRAVAGAIVRGIGTKVFWVQTGGFDTHASQGVNQANGAYANLMGTVNAAVGAFYADMLNQGLIDDTLILQFSEFGRRINENASSGTDHGAAAVMMALGGTVQGGLFGTAPSLNPGSDTLENNSNDVRFETDFRSVYAQVIDNWLGANSVDILGGDFRKPSLSFI
ncbi:MAG TPA: DUF1501 domain-containing protein [Vicinamibacterales bacterium]|nr:DUF1501 domain-containing protein [Vicinamibacterales bacterium]